MLKLSLRTLPLFAVIVGFATALGAYMNYSGVRTAYLDLIRDRMELVADDVAVVIESAVSVGIAPAEQTTLPGILARQAEADPMIRAIDVVAPEGEALFTSLPEGRAASGDRTSVLTLARSVRNDFGVEVARLVVTYDSLEPARRIDAFGRSILRDAFPTGLVAVLFGSLAAFLLFTRLHRRAARAAGPCDDDAIAAARREIEAAAGDFGK